MPNEKKYIGKTIQNKDKNKQNGRKCIYLLQTQKTRFCLKLKEENIDCPPKCPFFVGEEVGCYEDAMQKQYHIECLYCTRKTGVDQNPIRFLMFHCTLFNSQPFCSMCQFTFPELKEYNFMEVF